MHYRFEDFGIRLKSRQSKYILDPKTIRLFVIQRCQADILELLNSD